MDKIKASQFADLAYYSRFVPPSRTITFAAPASTLTNFPALVKCNSTFNIGTSTGYDVHFQELSGNELAYELDFYDSVTGNGAWWVKIPSLPSSGPTSIKMLYGDSSASTDGSTPLTVWADYAAVYHFNEIDYSYQTNRATGTQSSSSFMASGTASFQSCSEGTGRALQFTTAGTDNNKSYAIVTPDVSLSQEQYSTLGLWNKLAQDNTGSYGRWFVEFAPDITNVTPTNANSAYLQYQRGTSSGTLRTYSGSYPNNAESVITSMVSVYEMILSGTSVSDSNFRYAQINSQIVSGNSGAYSASYKWSANSTFLSMVEVWTGAKTTQWDELRFCKSAHSQDWMQYEYSMYCNHANCVTYGPEV